MPRVYLDEATGFSISYPTSLHPVVRDLKMFGGAEMGWVMVVDFMSSGPQPEIVLRVIAISASG